MRKILIFGFMGLVGIVIWGYPGVACLEEISVGEVLIVCNKHVPAESISKEEVKKIFLGRLTEWDDKKKIKFVTLKTEKDHRLFLKKYIGKSQSQYRNYFNMMVFTGKGRAPKAFQTVQELIDYVGNTEGAIGYISMTDKNKNIDTGDLKILRTE